MNTQKNNNKINDEISLDYDFSETANASKSPWPVLTFNYVGCNESISQSALILLHRDVNLILAALEQPRMIKGAIFPGENHGSNDGAPDDWVKLQGTVEAVDANGRVLKAHLLFKFNLTDTLESISLTSAYKFRDELNALMEKLS